MSGAMPFWAPWVALGTGLFIALFLVVTGRRGRRPAIASATPGGSPEPSVPSSTSSARTRVDAPAANAPPIAAMSHGESAEQPADANSEAPAASPFAEDGSLPSLADAEEDEDVDVTIVTLGPDSGSGTHEPVIEAEFVRDSAVPIVYDDDAAIDEPTGTFPLILVSAVGQTDRGMRRRRNEDSYIMLEEQAVFAVADGMGGYAGGEVAAWITTDTLAEAFQTSTFGGKPYPTVPRRGSEVVQAIQAANAAVFEQACLEPDLENMGTTVVCARFSPNKQRLYIGHVGDSRCYRLRGEELRQMTTDHTMASEGHQGYYADHLTRAVGIAPGIKVDLLIAKPRPGDRYMLCSDGLSKMIGDEVLRKTMLEEPEPKRAVARLIERANESGGKDNITVIVVDVRRPDFSI